MVNTVIGKSARCVKCFRIGIPCCNVTTVKTVVIRGNCMRGIVIIRPGNSCPFCNCQACFWEAHVLHGHRVAISSWIWWRPRRTIGTSFTAVTCNWGYHYSNDKQWQIILVFHIQPFTIIRTTTSSSCPQSSPALMCMQKLIHLGKVKTPSVWSATGKIFAEMPWFNHYSFFNLEGKGRMFTFATPLQREAAFLRTLTG